MNTILLDKKKLIEPFYGLDKDWCLPPRFWDRAAMFEGYSLSLLSRRYEVPIRKCHTTSLRVVSSSKNVKECSLEICTGHAFSEGKWFRHSWVVNRPDMTLLECTPIAFERYFGVILTRVEEQQFKEILGEV